MPMTRADSHRRLFFLIALALPVIVLALAEGLLRLSGFGTTYPLFVAFEPRPGYMQPNPEVIKRFFATPDAAPRVSIDTGFFRAAKAPGSLRIVVQGGSTAAGFPYGKNASPAALLQQRLRRTFPDREVEVVQTAMAAVNSYALRDFVDEIIAIKPDAVVIYAGHNEFLGILGVGSSFGPGASPAFTRLTLRLRELRLLQFMQRLYGLVTTSAEPRTGTLMGTIARERNIALGSRLYQRGVTQFRSNLAALLERYAEAGIPVFIGTLASNEKDQPPFSGSPEPVSADWPGQRDAVRAALQAAATADALMLAEALVDTAPSAAEAHFLLGRAALAQGDRERARNAFAAALDRDRLRFRAPTVFDKLIREAATAHDAVVVEAHAKLASASPEGVIGAELMLEHLHPNHTGYLLLAEAFYEALAGHGLGLDWRVVDTAQARSEQTLTRVEKLHGEYRVTRLLNDWPFVETKRDWQPPTPQNEEQRIAQAWYHGKLDWIGAMNAALAEARRSGDYAEATRIATNLADAFPFESQLQHLAGRVIVNQTPPDGLRALPYFHNAATLEPDNVEYLVTLTRAYWLNGFRDAAAQTARRLQILAPTHAATREITELLQHSASD